MKTPRETPADTSTRSTADLARELLDKDHPNSYMLFSLDQSSTNEPSYQKEFFHNQVCRCILRKKRNIVFRFLIFHCLMKNNNNHQLYLLIYGFVKK